MDSVNIGMTPKELKKVAEHLTDFLADTYALYLKTQNFHWNIVGNEFFSLHVLFEKHYEDMAEAVDEIAERIRSLGHYAEGSFSEFKKRTHLKEPKKGLSAKKMLEELVQDHELISQEGRNLIRVSQEHHDEISADLVIKRLGFHEKAGWMLRSHLEKVKI